MSTILGSNLVLNGRNFTVTAVAPHAVGINAGTSSYSLAGERGANYRTMRNVADPRQMMLVDVRRGKMAVGFEHIRLTDADGSLRRVTP